MFNLTLWQRGKCLNDYTKTQVFLKSVHVDGNYSEYEFTNLTIEEAIVYTVSIQAINRAALFTSAATSPVAYDSSSPTAGHVTEGSVFSDDVVWWGYTDHMNGSLLYYHHHVSDPCPSRKMSLLDPSWTNLQRRNLNDPDGIAWKLEHREANIHRDKYEDSVTIKIARDSKAERVYTAAYMRQADLKDGGIYEISVKAADGNGKAVTGVTFWDGEENDLHLYKHDHFEEVSCSCCLEVNQTACGCNCTDYLMRVNQTIDVDVMNDTSIDINVTVLNGPTIPQQACGVQIFSEEPPYVVTWCRFFNYTGELMSVRSEVDFNPSSDFHRYKIAFVNIKEDISVTNCIQVSVDDKQVSEMCGIPSLGESTKVVLHVWHKNNVVPDLDIFNLWTAKATFQKLIMPPAVNELCRFGKPFQGGQNAVVGFEAAIGTSPMGDDVAPFKIVKKPCVPCSGPCSRFDCQQSCNQDAYELLKFSVSSLDLNASFGGSYYLSVKVILGSGAEAISSSDGFYIDTSPPDFDETVMMYIDVRQGEFTPADFQGSNNTIKALWLCNDDKSEIQEYQWAIGTYPGGQDIQEYVSTGAFSTGINTDLENVLEHNRTYFVSIKCTNGAGLSTLWTDTKGVTVLLAAPDPNTVSAEAVGAEHFADSVSPPTAVKSSDPSFCGESWTLSTDPNIRRYDFCVGSSKDIINDIIPCIWVGYNTSGIVEIKNGSLCIDGIAFRKISELRVLSEERYDFAVEDTTDNTFRMETGRTLFLFMRLCNKAEICIVKFVNTLLITNENATLATSTNGEALSVTVNSKTRTKRSLSDIIVETPGNLVKGQSILVNELTDADMDTRYDSTASSVFKPYVVQPTSTSYSTERLLHRRILGFERSFTISPVGQLQMPGPLEISFPQSHYNASGNDNKTMLIHWNADIGLWQISSQTCQTYSKFEEDDPVAGTTTVKICDTRRSSLKIPDVNDTFFYAETQFALASVKAALVNSPPALKEPAQITLEEDSEMLEIHLDATDEEGDPFYFNLSKIITQYDFGQVSLHESGYLYIIPCPNCYGVGKVDIILQDDPLWYEILPASAEYSVTITVTPINDPPTIEFISNEGKSMLLPDPTEEIMIFREQTNLPFTLNLGTLVAFDIDGAQHLEIFTLSNSTKGMFNLTDMEANEIWDKVSCSDRQCEFFDISGQLSRVAWKVYGINYTQSNESFVGVDRIKLVAQDNNGTYSDVITLTIVVMENKCIHGTCASLNPKQYTCNDTRRAESFDQYYTCQCPTSWQGLYCDVDVDECTQGFCETWKICENTVGSFDCYCKPSDIICKLSLEEWEFALIVVALSAVIVAIVALVISRKYKSQKGVTKDVDLSGDSIFSRKEGLGPSKPRLVFRPKIYPLDPLEEDANNKESMEDFIHPEPISDTLGARQRKPRFNFTMTEMQSTFKDTVHEEEDDTCVHPKPNAKQPHAFGLAQDEGTEDFAPPMSFFTARKKDPSRPRPSQLYSKFAAIELEKKARMPKMNSQEIGDSSDSINSPIRIERGTKLLAYQGLLESEPIYEEDIEENVCECNCQKESISISVNSVSGLASSEEPVDVKQSTRPRSSAAASRISLSNSEMTEVDC